MYANLDALELLYDGACVGGVDVCEASLRAAAAHGQQLGRVALGVRRRHDHLRLPVQPAVRTRRDYHTYLEEEHALRGAANASGLLAVGSFLAAARRLVLHGRGELVAEHRADAAVREHTGRVVRVDVDRVRAARRGHHRVHGGPRRLGLWLRLCVPHALVRGRDAAAGAHAVGDHLCLVAPVLVVRVGGALHPVARERDRAQPRGSCPSSSF